VELTLQNHGGEGEAKVVVRLKSDTDGRVYSADETVELRAGQGLQVVIDVAAPMGPYSPSVDVESPPR
jgi:hypothetical protein